MSTLQIEMKTLPPDEAIATKSNADLMSPTVVAHVDASPEKKEVTTPSPEETDQGTLTGRQVVHGTSLIME